MDWDRLRFFLSEVTRSFTRNPAMQITTIATVTVTILILGTFLFAKHSFQTVGDDIVRKIEISVFLDEHLNAPAEQKLQREIQRDPRVRSITFIPKDLGLKQMRDRLRGQVDTSLLTVNPLPDALRVKVIDPANVPSVAAHISKLPGVATTVYAEDAVNRLLRLGDILSHIGLGVVVLLTATATIIITNTIRLTVFARRREIQVMQLVGASSMYIRAPFIVEGLIHGVLGAALAVILLGVAQAQFLPKLQAALPFIPLALSVHDAQNDILLLLATGSGVGIVASWFSVGRHLRA